MQLETFWNENWSVKGNMIANMVLASLRPRFRGKSPKSRYKLARRLIDEAFERFRTAPDTPALGCQSSNCFGCCLHQKEIDVSGYEVDLILNRVTSETRLEEVVTRADALVAKKTGGACPLLSKDGRCTVYDIRPLACAAYHSLDRDACHSGANAKIAQAETLFIETALITGFGMRPVEEMDAGSQPQRFYLFQELAARGRARLQRRRAA